jgi:hypothetical protein
MSIDFSTLQGLTIPEGVVEQIADASGRVIWTGGKPIVLQVEKIVSNTYAGETTYENEEFILLDIYPKTNGTVSVTYGGLTKTITDVTGVANPNAQQVVFGTFNGLKYDETPASGELTIKGSYNGFGCGIYYTNNKGFEQSCGCITDVIEFGKPKVIPDMAFNNCAKLTDITIPEGITSIGNARVPLTSGAFGRCTSLSDVKLPNSLKELGSASFTGCTSLTSITIPDGVGSLPMQCFSGCENLAGVFLPRGLTRIGLSAFQYCKNLLMLKIPEGVVEISDGAFYMPNMNVGSTYYPDYIPVTKMKNATITVPSTILKIGKNVWGYDGNAVNGNFYINNLVILATTPPEIPAEGLGAFGYTITVPKGCAEAYKAAENWLQHSGQIVEAS